MCVDCSTTKTQRQRKTKQLWSCVNSAGTSVAWMLITSIFVNHFQLLFLVRHGARFLFDHNARFLFERRSGRDFLDCQWLTRTIQLKTEKNNFDACRTVPLESHWIEWHHSAFSGSLPTASLGPNTRQRKEHVCLAWNRIEMLFSS